MQTLFYSHKNQSTQSKHANDYKKANFTVTNATTNKPK